MTVGYITNPLRNEIERVRGHRPNPATVFCSKAGSRWAETNGAVIEISAFRDDTKLYQDVYLNQDELDRALPDLVESATTAVRNEVVRNVILGLTQAEFLSLMAEVFSSPRAPCWKTDAPVPVSIAS